MRCQTAGWLWRGNEWLGAREEESDGNHGNQATVAVLPSARYDRVYSEGDDNSYVDIVQGLILCL